MVENTIDRCARAIAGVRERYMMIFWRGGGANPDPSWNVWVGEGADVEKVVSFPTEAECQAWIDTQAARACVAELLPVSANLLDAIFQADVPNMTSETANLPDALRILAGEFTAAIHAILERAA